VVCRILSRLVVRRVRSQGRYDGGMDRLNFDAPVEELQDVAAPGSVERPVVAGTGALFGEDEELPPTWAEGSDVYHVTEKCTRLRTIRKNRRVQSKTPPSWMRPCFNCEDIVRAKRLG
jgi:hypothetical protein